MDDTAAEDWFTAEFLEFADSLAGQATSELTEEGLVEGGQAQFGVVADSYHLQAAQGAVTPGA